MLSFSFGINQFIHISYFPQATWGNKHKPENIRMFQSDCYVKNLVKYLRCLKQVMSIKMHKH